MYDPRRNPTEAAIVHESVRPSTLGELKASGYQVRPVREEMRRNVLDRA